MPRRPTVVSVVAVLLIVLSALSGLGLAVAGVMQATNPELKQHMAERGQEMTGPLMAVSGLQCVATLIAGALVWQGRDSGRWLYIGATALGNVAGIAMMGFDLAMIPGFVIAAGLVGCLYLPSANAFFRGEELPGAFPANRIVEVIDDDVADTPRDASDPFAAPRVRQVDPDDVSVIRQVIGYMLFVGAGFAVIMAGFGVGMRFPIPNNAPFGMEEFRLGFGGAFSVAALIGFLLGTLAIGGRTRLKRAGLAAAISAGCGLMFLSSAYASMQSPEVQEQLKRDVGPELANMYADAWIGLIYFAVVAAVAGLTWLVGWKRAARPS